MIPRSKLVVAPLEKPVSLDEAKLFLRIDHSDEDTLIDALIDSATTRLESEVNTKFINQTWEIFFDHFPYGNVHLNETWQQGTLSSLTRSANHINLPFGKLVSVEKFSVFDSEDNETTVDSSNYQEDNTGHYGRVSLRYGGTWPTTVLRLMNGIRFECVFGLSSTELLLPRYIKTAVLEMVAALYEYRGDEYPKIPATAMMLLEPLKRYRVGCR